MSFLSAILVGMGLAIGHALADVFLTILLIMLGIAFYALVRWLVD